MSVLHRAAKALTIMLVPSGFFVALVLAFPDPERRRLAVCCWEEAPHSP